MNLIILIGLQASGKSTFARARFADYAYVSKDAMRNVKRNKNQRQEAAIRQALGRFMRYDPFYALCECEFGMLALESKSVDSRL